MSDMSDKLFNAMQPNKALEILTHAMCECEDTAERIEAWAAAQEALDKQIPKKPIKTDNQDVRYTMCYKCPRCELDFMGTGIADYCYHCGQALWWGDEPNPAWISTTNPDYELVRIGLRVEKSEWLKLLTEREAHILVLRYGLDGNGKRTYEQIGKEYGVTRERIRQIVHKALRKLRIDYWSKEV